MIDTIELDRYQNVANCKTDQLSSRESFLPISYRFRKGNVYGLVSDFGCGSWGLTTCLGGRGDRNDSGKVLLNGQMVKSQQLSQYAAFVAERVIPEVCSADASRSARECIGDALRLSGQAFTPEEIKSAFQLSDERFDRPLAQTSGEIWPISIAIQFALGKDIFCFPWMNMHDISRFRGMWDMGIIQYLRESQKIVLVPTSQKKAVKKMCDHLIVFEKENIRL